MDRQGYAWGLSVKCWSQPLVEHCDQHGRLVADGKLVVPRSHGPAALEAVDPALDGMPLAVVGLVELRRPTASRAELLTSWSISGICTTDGAGSDALVINRQVGSVQHDPNALSDQPDRYRVEVARHERLIAKGGCRLDLDHYLEALIRKPGAFPGATALEQARSAGKFTPVHDAWWAAAVKAHGDTAGTRALIEVLLLGRHVSHEHLVAGLAMALRAGALTADAVALEARKVAQAEDEPAGHLSPGGPAGEVKVTFLHEWRLAHLPPDTRPLPSVTHYDQLLRRRRTSGGEHREGEAQ
ncbi:hypothetical protein [Streptomyces sp. Ag109_G2-15]|uniref:hypothetical protein n=1 Tax=Streptomyces sp. Ag109_G2-15 TaxID=1938850 RepID=UPI00211C9E90|nr:hypothetical protein [Streptomyces sp. Ag109_G2-15]